MTSDFQIKEVLKNIKNFGGVYLYNQLDDIAKLGNEAIIINYVTEDESKRGIIGHFVVLDNRDILKGNGTYGLYFFDPYGFPPDAPRGILGLPNTQNILRLIDRTGGKWNYNKEDFQAWAKFDNLCGVYSSEYVINPNFNKNKLFHYSNRLDVDKKLMKIFDSLNYVDHPTAKYSNYHINLIRDKLGVI